MQDAAIVRRLDRARNLNREANGVFRRDRSEQCLALDKLEHEIPVANIVNLTDVRVVERCNRARFLLKAMLMRGLDRLERDDAIEPRVERLPDRSHAAGTERREDFVGADSGSNREDHRRQRNSSYRPPFESSA